MQNKPTILVTGAGGFIGHHLVKYLVKRGYVVRGVDIKAPEYETTDADEFVIADLRNYAECTRVTKNVDEVYHLAADMGGIGYISDRPCRRGAMSMPGAVGPLLLTALAAALLGPGIPHADDTARDCTEAAILRRRRHR